MNLPLLLKVYQSLRRGWKSLTSDAQQAVATFVASQKTAEGYMNAGGKVDEYYTQFGQILEAVMSPTPGKLLRGWRLGVKEHTNKEDVYGVFFKFLADEWRPWRRLSSDAKPVTAKMTNTVCCQLAMLHQQGKRIASEEVAWLQERQDQTGGFYASEQAPIPDMLSTAVSLFTLRLIGASPAINASDFILVHWLENGAFAPTLLDEYSDVEYVFYGLMALGSKGN